MKKSFSLIGLLVVASMILSACGTGAVETIIITQEVGGEIVEVVVTATPEAMEEQPVTMLFNWAPSPQQQTRR